MTGPGAPSPTTSVIHLHDRHDFPRGTGEKGFVGAKQILVAQDGLPDRDRAGSPNFPGDLEHEFPGDARQAGRRRAAASTRRLLDDEQVRLRALGELSAIIPHHAFERAAAKRLLHRQGVVQQVVRFDRAD